MSNQSVEAGPISSKSDPGLVDSYGWLNVTAIGDMFRTIVNRHGNRWYEHVNDITNHTTNHQRISGRHHREDSKQKPQRRTKEREAFGVCVVLSWVEHRLYTSCETTYY